jgi:cytochrome c556
MRIALALLILLPVQDEKRGPKNAEVRKAYRALMKDVEKENDALKKDLEAKKADAAIKERLKAIRKGVEAASKLDYLKGPEKDVEEFKALFGIFLDIRMKTFLESEWTPDSSEKLYERLQGACRTCHELFRED